MIGQVQVKGTQLATSRMGLGTHALHRLLSAPERRNLLALAFDLGVRHFDTAPSYGDGLAESELGRFGHGRRSQLVLTTKFGIPAGRLGGRLPGWNQVAMAARVARRILGSARSRGTARNFSAGEACSSVESSLRALATDHLDILFLHEPTPESLGEPEELGRVLDTLKAAGKIRYTGLSGQYAACATIAGRHPFLADVLQVQIPAAADGLPPEGHRKPQEAAIGFWEFPPGSGRAPAGWLQQALARLQAAVPQSVLLVSTNCAAQLRESAAMLTK